MLSFSFNRKVIVSRLLPTLLRKSKFVAWLYALTSPVGVLHAELIGFRNSTNNTLSISSETLLFEYYLRQKYNDDSVRVINKVVIAPTIKVGLDSENITCNVGYPGESPLFVGYLTEMSDNEYDFEVQIPTALSDKQVEIIALIKLYKVFSKVGIVVLI